MSPTRFFVLTIFWTFTFAFLIVAVALSQKGDIKRPPPGRSRFWSARNLIGTEGVPDGVRGAGVTA